jgi:SAM-dependent methyltransferase
MTLAERILLSLSRHPGSSDYDAAKVDWSIDDALSILTREYPDFENQVSNKRVLDFGCGTGHQSVALAKKYDCSVVGVDNNPKALEQANALRDSENLSEARVSFVDKITDGMKGTFDVAISQNSFEHFGDPLGVLDTMRDSTTTHGRILISFGPPWFAPYGSHMHFFCKVPWLNLLFSEETIIKVRSRFRSDKATKYKDVEGGLNKMSVSRFERIIASSGLRVRYRKYSCVKQINFLASIPLLRELFINHISVSLVKNA